MNGLKTNFKWMSFCKENAHNSFPLKISANFEFFPLSHNEYVFH